MIELCSAALDFTPTVSQVEMTASLLSNDKLANLVSYSTVRSYLIRDGEMYVRSAGKCGRRKMMTLPVTLRYVTLL